MTNLTPRQIDAVFWITSAMNMSRSTVEKLLSQAKARSKAKNVRNMIYKLARAGVIVVCFFVFMNADEAWKSPRRPVRNRRGELITIV